MTEKKEQLFGFLLKKENLVILLCAGVLLFFTASPMNLGSRKQENPVQETVEQINNEQEVMQQLKVSLQHLEGVGEVEVQISFRQDKVYGVLVLLEGADLPGMKNRITQLIMALYGIEANHIFVDQLG